MRAPSSVIVDVAATRISCPRPGPLYVNDTMGSISPVPRWDGKWICTTTSLAQRHMDST
jgi:hypothetical protein